MPNFIAWPTPIRRSLPHPASRSPARSYLDDESRGYLPDARAPNKRACHYSLRLRRKARASATRATVLEADNPGERWHRAPDYSFRFAQLSRGLDHLRGAPSHDNDETHKPPTRLKARN